MVIAVDFDGTIVTHAYPKIGKEIPFATDTLIRLQEEEHHTLILWTMRTGKLLEEAIEWCKERGLEFYAVNKNHPEEKYDLSMPRKLNVDLFIDDRNFGGMPEWSKIYRSIKGLPEENPYAESEEDYSAYENRNLFLKIGFWIEKMRNRN